MPYLHERPDGVLIEYRLSPQCRPGILDLESRELRRDGTPHSEDWYVVSDYGLLWLQRTGSDIVELLEQEAWPAAQ